MKKYKSCICLEFNLIICSAVIVSKQSIKEIEEEEVKIILKNSISVLEVVMEKCMADKSKIEAVKFFKVLLYIIKQTGLAITL